MSSKYYWEAGLRFERYLAGTLIGLGNGLDMGQGFPGSSVGKESSWNAGDMGLIPGPGRYPGEGHGYPIQYSCLENPMIRGAWWATVHGVARVRHDLVTKPLERRKKYHRCPDLQLMDSTHCAIY